MSKQALLAVISGFAGSGKGSAMKGLMEAYPDQYMLSVSMTTRDPRPGEENGREYWFVTDEEFEREIQRGGLIEHAGYVGHYYGTPKAPVEKAMSEGKDVLLEIEIQGALKVKEQFPEAILLFLAPPDAVELKKRLVGRGTEDEETVKKRLARAAEEAKGIGLYDYLVINDELPDCIQRIRSILETEKMRTRNCSDLVRSLQEGTAAYKGGEKE